MDVNEVFVKIKKSGVPLGGRRSGRGMQVVVNEELVGEGQGGCEWSKVIVKMQ